MARGRDSQRSRVYEWERRCVRDLAGLSLHDPEKGFEALEQCIAYATPIWRKERGRVGLAKVKAPSIERPAWGQRRALANDWRHAITLPKWARNRWVILHEMAHLLTPRDVAHGPRFVGVLIGLAARWLDYDATQLMAWADEAGVKYYVRSIGSVPILGPAAHVERALRSEGPMTTMDLASWLSLGMRIDVTERQVRGAAAGLARRGRVRWLRGKLHLVDGANAVAV